MFMGLDVTIWIVVVLYFAAMLLMGWWSRHRASSQSGYLIGDRSFGTPMMVMHAFGAGTNPSDTAGVISGTVQTGASGIWASWLWLFGTPFYWLIAPAVRRLRCLTVADYFYQRFGAVASMLYIVVAAIAMTICLASVLLGTTSTVLGMMGKAAAPDAKAWFYGILLTATVTFMIYGYWGGIVAAIRTDFVQGLMIIALSFLAVPAAMNLPDVGGLEGMRKTLADASRDGVDYLRLFDPKRFDLVTVILLCVQAPLSAMALPHLVTICGAGKTEWEGRMGISGGNILKRICTIGWSVLGLCWLAHLIRSGAEIHPDAAFGDSIGALLPPVLQGLMLACVMAAAMSSGDAFQVTVAGLFSENVYRRYIRPDATDHQAVRVTKIAGVVFVLASLGAAILFQSVVTAILVYFNILALVGISTGMGLLWRRMNQTGMIVATVLASATYLTTRYLPGCPGALTIGGPIAVGILGGIVGSLLTAPPPAEVIDRFFTRIHVPIGREDLLERPLDEVVPPERRLLTAGGLFIVKPSRQSWVGFLVILAICVGCVLTMLALLNL